MKNKINNIPEIIKHNDGTNFYVLLTQREIDKLEKILKENSAMFPKQKNALSTLLKLIIENTYLYINNKEFDIDDDINKVLDKIYFDDLDNNFKELIKTNSKARDFIVELVRVRTLKKYTNPSDPQEELIKKQFRLANEDTLSMSILLGSAALSSPDYIASLIRYFLNSNKFEILNYRKVLMIERAIREKQYLIIDNRKVKPIGFVNWSTVIRIKELLYFDETNKKLLHYPLVSYFYEKNIEATELKYSLNSLEEKIINLVNELKNISISFDRCDTPIKELDTDKHISESAPISIVINTNIGEHKSTNVNYSESIIKTFRNYQKIGYIKNLVFSDNYNEYEKAIEEYKES